MDIYVALADFHAPSRHKTVLSFKKGDGFEILEKGDGDNCWWGARRLRGNKVGWVPSQYLKYDRKETEESLPNNYFESRRHYVKRLGAMQRGNEHKLPDIYKLPPVGVQSFDDWRKTSSQSGSGTSDPEPDYTDEEEGDDPQMAQIQQIGGMKLSKSDWQKILDRAEDNLEPEPDYEITAEKRHEYEERKDAEGLVAPKHVSNPVLKSSQRMDVHKELLWNQKRGIDVLHRKSELKKEMERRQTKKTDKIKENDPDRKTTFEKLLDERAEKIKQKGKQEEAKKKKVPTATLR